MGPSLKPASRTERPGLPAQAHRTGAGGLSFPEPSASLPDEKIEAKSTRVQRFAWSSCPHRPLGSLCWSSHCGAPWGSVEGLSNLLENDSKDPSDCPST